MFPSKLNPQMAEATGGRSVGGTEHSWCKAVLGGTGIVVLAILSSKKPDVSNLENALKKLQSSHPILMSEIYSSTSNTFFLAKSPTPYIKVKSFDISSTTKILKTHSNQINEKLFRLEIIIEHELNENTWYDGDQSLNTNSDVLFASIYTLSEKKWVFVIRAHIVACDRTTGVSLLRELLALMGDEGSGGGLEMEIGNKGEVNLGIEDLIPNGKAKKGLWERGVDMLGYSVNSLRLTNLKFKDSKSNRSSQVVRFQINKDDTERIFTGCKRRGIKLCGVLAAAGLMAAHGPGSSVKSLSDHHRKKYGVVTLLDCRSILDPSLSTHHFGFYHSAILNTHVMKGGETVWELAKKMYAAFENSKNSNKHLTDMADLNFLMCKAIDNPGLTQSSSLRTSFMSVFEDTVIDNSDEMYSKVGIDDCIGCASVHGIGPSIGIFDTVRDGRLDCICVYPAPLHSREQMQGLVDEMKGILIDGSQIR